MIDRVKMNLQIALISQHYGLGNQIIQTSEEVGELLQAMSKYKRDPSEIHQNAIATEVADVYIMLKQIVQLVGLSDEKIIDNIFPLVVAPSGIIFSNTSSVNPAL